MGKNVDGWVGVRLVSQKTEVPPEAMTSNRLMFIVEYEDGRTREFSIDRWTLSLGDYAATLIARERQE
jgi:hypothetical protein